MHLHHSPSTFINKLDTRNKRVYFLHFLRLLLRICLYHLWIELPSRLHHVNLLLVDLIDELPVVPVDWHRPIGQLIEAVEDVHAVAELLVLRVQSIHHLLPLVLTYLHEQLRLTLLFSHRLKFLIHFH
jgi:hypothetical protein